MTASAKSLFRALKSQRKPEEARREHDFYPTGQPEAMRALLAVDGDRIRSFGQVWEPAVGAGDLVHPIIEGGMDVIGSDIVDRGWAGTEIRSFFDFTDAPCPVIITNPPYSLINARDGHGKWLRHTLSLPSWRYCALLLSWDWPAARQNGLGAMLDTNPFSYCYLMRWKLDFTGEGSPPQRNAWFVWDRDWTGPEPAFRWLDKIDGRQGSFDIEHTRVGR